jgi:hypothetical protein
VGNDWVYIYDVRLSASEHCSVLLRSWLSTSDQCSVLLRSWLSTSDQWSVLLRFWSGRTFSCSSSNGTSFLPSVFWPLLLHIKSVTSSLFLLACHSNSYYKDLYFSFYYFFLDYCLFIFFSDNYYSI